MLARGRIVLLTVLYACASEPPQHGQDTDPAVFLRSRDSNALVTVSRHPADTASGGRFDAEGYYFPAEQFTDSGYQLKWFALETRRAWVRLSRVDNENDFQSIDCPRPIITPDTLELNCPGTPVGHIVVVGSFTDKRGSFWDRADVEPEKTVVLMGQVVITSSAGKNSRFVRFTYWQGD